MFNIRSNYRQNAKDLLDNMMDDTNGCQTDNDESENFKTIKKLV